MDTLKHTVIVVCAATMITALVPAFLVISNSSDVEGLLSYAKFIIAGAIFIFILCMGLICYLTQKIEKNKQTVLDRELERKKEWALFEFELKMKETSLKKEWKIFEQKLQNEDKDAQLRRELETKKETSTLNINEKKTASQLSINENKANSEIIINEKHAALNRAVEINEIGLSISSGYDPYK